MILRRITEHVKAQNWFAVGLDFIIVVIGVGVALAAGEWVGVRGAKADLKIAETAIHTELYQNYLNALERRAVSDCTNAQITEIASRLTNTDEAWAPIDPFPVGGEISGSLGALLRTPYRGAWSSTAWTAAGDSNLLIHMAPDTRNTLSEIFSISATVSGYQDTIYNMQSELKSLMIARGLTDADRLRYYDVLAKLDAANALVAVGSETVIERVEGLNISVQPEVEQQFLEDLAGRNKAGFDVYGECFQRMVLPGAEETR